MRTIRLSTLAALSLAILGACQMEDATTGTVQANLVGQAPSGTAYRLRHGNLVVQGPSSTTFWDTETNLATTVLSENVPAGHYTVFLQEGWHLERLAADGTGTAVEAQLTSANPLPFDVTAGARTTVPMHFHVGEGPIDMATGYDITIGVDEQPTAATVCSSNADCSGGQTCCLTGFLGTCQALAAGAACPLPDLTVDANTALTSMSISHRSFEPTSCALVEQCVNGPGDRRLLSFSTQTPNIGAADMVLGDPTTQPGFEYSACHGHYHFEGYANYELLDAASSVVATGHKQAFCLLDLSPMAGTTSAPRYHCGFQGISRGWSDVYGAGLDCQWVDITTVPAGDYRLRITINGDHRLPESDYSNNTIEVPVTIGADVPVVPGDPLSACAGVIPGLQRDCGWQIAAGQQAVACTPGASVTLGCGCSAGGVCVGDPMVRVCDGDGACTAATAVAMNDDSCGTTCSQATFVCPASGAYTVLTGAYNTSVPFTCDIGTAAP